MGHIRLGRLSQSKKVIDLISGGADVRDIAAATSADRQRRRRHRRADAARGRESWLSPPARPAENGAFIELGDDGQACPQSRIGFERGDPHRRHVEAVIDERMPRSGGARPDNSPDRDA